LLNRNIRNARIMTYGYDAEVVNWGSFRGVVSTNNIKYHAQNLLQNLAIERVEQSHRVVIICISPVFCVS
jgi:hypothetical protein